MGVNGIGKQIRERRDTLGLTQPDLAEMAGISKNTLYKIETGQGNPTLNVLHKIAQILGMEFTMTVQKPGQNR
ncbi:MAG: XRE family transcriptional regulator [Balneolaceae bacterium]|nr:MAG: XRE family transcriptional regulator [Balneolaceae bacterium]